MAMALFVGARLADGCVAARPVESAARKLRVVGARHWIGSVTLPAPARSAVLQLFDSSGADDRPGVAAAVEKLAAIATALLDAPSRAEIKQLLAALRTA